MTNISRMLVCLMAIGLLLTLAPATYGGEAAGSCQYCGMDLGKFAHSRMQIHYDDDTVVNTCSIHCAALDLAINIGKTPASISVGDHSTRKLINAESAHWVIGGDKAGVMSRVAKWAFRDEADAKVFIAGHGGKQAGFSTAIERAYQDMYEDTKMIREKRKQMMKRGMKH